MAETQNLAARIDAALAAMDDKRRKAEVEAKQREAQWQQRLEKLGGTFDRLREIWKPRLELLVQKFGDKVKGRPTVTPSTRSVDLEFPSDAARIRLRLQATTDHDIRKVILNYDLEIIPILMQFDSHAQLEMPLEAVDPDAVGGWIDERIISFVNTYVAVHENEYYRKA